MTNSAGHQPSEAIRVERFVPPVVGVDISVTGGDGPRGMGDFGRLMKMTEKPRSEDVADKAPRDDAALADITGPSIFEPAGESRG